ncbi:MAG: hypothetical protein ABIK39_02700 [candidate division WOR-3 bacterium]
MRSKRQLSQVLFALWVIFTTAALLLPTPTPPKMLRRGMDKTVHTSLFFVMGGLGQVALPYTCFGITIPIAVGVEYLQRVVIKDRQFEAADIFANLVGLLLGVFLTELVTRLRSGA